MFPSGIVPAGMILHITTNMFLSFRLGGVQGGFLSATHPSQDRDGSQIYHATQEYSHYIAFIFRFTIVKRLIYDIFNLD